MLKGPKLAHRDGRFRFVKKYKEDLNSQTSVVDVPSFRAPTTSDSMLQKKQSKHAQTSNSHIVTNQFSAGLGAGSNICTGTPVATFGLQAIVCISWWSPSRTFAVTRLALRKS